MFRSSQKILESARAASRRRASRGTARVRLGAWAEEVFFDLTISRRAIRSARDCFPGNCAGLRGEKREQRWTDRPNDSRLKRHVALLPCLAVGVSGAERGFRLNAGKDVESLSLSEGRERSERAERGCRFFFT
jgi:hypothetical protein